MNEAGSTSPRNTAAALKRPSDPCLRSVLTITASLLDHASCHHMT
jgi:hypothetical protein